MSDPLERVISVRQSSKAATALPLELQQQIFSYLDTKSFYTARKTCKYWHYASSDALPLARQLRRLPILPLVDAVTSSPAELQRLYDEAARTLMIGVKIDRMWDRPGSLTRASSMGFHITPRVTATTSGNRTVTLNGRQIALFETSGEKPVCLAQRCVNDLIQNVGNGPWLKVQPNTYNELALSSDGRLLAIAQERTIQIYDLYAEPDSFTVNDYVSSASGHYICGLDFEQDDHLLRVRLSGKGTILYLGTPPASDKRGEKATTEHWKSKAGLRHTFVDSSLLTIQPSSNEADQIARVAGLQLLQPFEGGYLFAGQKHGGGESSHYILGHMNTSRPHNVATKAEPHDVTVLARLESFLSSWDFTLESGSERGMGLWENMPSAHEHHPLFALDMHASFLALAERDKKRIRPAPLTQLFIYRIPREDVLRTSLAQQRARREGKWATLASFLDRVEQQNASNPAEDGKPEDTTSATQMARHTVARVPLCLSTIQGEITAMSFNKVDATTSSICVTTVDTSRTWLLQDY